MFFQTDPRLLGPIHSLLDKPFSFAAAQSISAKLYKFFGQREDYDDLVALCHVYDQAKAISARAIPKLQHLLANSVAVQIPLECDLNGLCWSTFIGKAPKLCEIGVHEYLSRSSVQCQLERLYDQFALTKMGEGNPLSSNEILEVLRLFLLNEALALCLAGLVTVKKNKDRFDLRVFDPTSQNALRTTWFARAMDQNSHMATLAMCRHYSAVAQITVTSLEPLINRILDQDLSISWKRLSSKGLALQSVQEIYSATALVAVLMVTALRKEEVQMTRLGLVKYGLDFSAVSRVLNRQAQALVTDKFVIRKGNVLELQVEGSSKGLRNYFRTLENEFGERDQLRLHVGGFFFEKKYIRSRIENGEDYQSRYVIVDGFTRDEVLDNAKNKTDVEFIIKDKRLGCYYFVQIKHALLGEKAFFDSVVEEIQKDLGSGVKQLREAKRLLETDNLVKTLAARGIVDATHQNSYFVLLHNIAQFDFQSTHDGISLYDWATFRNLLKDAECFLGATDSEGKLLRLSTPLLIDKPIKVIERLLGEHPAYQKMLQDPWVGERASTVYKILGHEISVHGLGI